MFFNFLHRNKNTELLISLTAKNSDLQKNIYKLNTKLNEKDLSNFNELLKRNGIM